MQRDLLAATSVCAPEQPGAAGMQEPAVRRKRLLIWSHVDVCNVLAEHRMLSDLATGGCVAIMCNSAF